MLSQIKNIFFKKLKKFSIGIIDCPIDVFINDPYQVKVNWIDIVDKNNFIADPFIFEEDNKKYIFVEEYNAKLEKGHISFTELKENGKLGKFVKVIDENNHLSYPYILKVKDTIYCIPEMAGSNGLFIYEFINFPNEWKRNLLFIGNIIDPQLFFHNDYWWLFHTIENEDTADANIYLHIKYSKEIHQGWQDHPQNPVKKDISTARSAGPIFTIGNDLYRPAQDCKEDYGKQLAVNKIKILTTTEYQEETVKIIAPFANSNYPDGLHHISSIQNTTVIDGYCYQWKLRNIKESYLILINLVKNKIVKH